MSHTNVDSGPEDRYDELEWKKPPPAFYKATKSSHQKNMTSKTLFKPCACPIPQLAMELNLKIFGFVLADPVPVKILETNLNTGNEKTARGHTLLPRLASTIGISFKPFMASSTWLHLAMEVFMANNTFAFFTHEAFIQWEHCLARETTMALFRHRIQHLFFFAYKSLEDPYMTTRDYVERIPFFLEDLLATSIMFYPRIKTLGLDFRSYDPNLFRDKPETISGRQNDERVLLILHWLKFTERLWWGAVGEHEEHSFITQLKTVLGTNDPGYSSPVEIILRGGAKNVWLLILRQYFDGIANMDIKAVGFDFHPVLLKKNAVEGRFVDVMPIDDEVFRVDHCPGCLVCNSRFWWVQDLLNRVFWHVRGICRYHLHEFLMGRSPYQCYIDYFVAALLAGIAAYVALFLAGLMTMAGFHFPSSVLRGTGDFLSFWLR